MDNVQKNLSTLKFLAKCHPKIRKAILKYSDNDLIIAISECVLNCLKGNIEVKSDVTEELLKYKNTLRQLSKKQKGVRSNIKKKLLIQKGGFLPIILPTILSFFSNLLDK